MSKLCKHCGKYPVWGGGMCRYHQNFRTDKKPKTLKTTRKKTGEMEMFNAIWEERTQPDGSHVSEISGKNLDGYYNTMFYPNLFMHVLPKGKYPHARLSKENIVLGTPQEHWCVDIGTAAQRQQYEQENNCSFDIFYKKQQTLKQEYDGHTNV